MVLKNTSNVHQLDFEKIKRLEMRDEESGIALLREVIRSELIDLESKIALDYEEQIKQGRDKTELRQEIVDSVPEDYRAGVIQTLNIMDGIMRAKHAYKKNPPNEPLVHEKGISSAANL